MVNHYLNIACSFLYCFEPFCCCTVLPCFHPPAMLRGCPASCRTTVDPRAGPTPEVDRPSSCTPKLQEIFIYTIQLKGGFFKIFFYAYRPIGKKNSVKVLGLLEWRTFSRALRGGRIQLQLKSVAVECLTPLVPLEVLSVIIQTENYNFKAPFQCRRTISSSSKANNKIPLISVGLEVA